LHRLQGELSRPTFLRRWRISNLKRAADSAFDILRTRTTSGSNRLFDGPDIVDGARAGIRHRINRFERRVIAAAKRRESHLAEEIATARGALFPLGKIQERALNAVPLMARHGEAFLSSVRAGAAHLARDLVSGAARPPVEELPAARESSAHV
jgi:hypothetical protein